MRIEVIKEIDEQTKEVYGFNLFDITAVFVTYHREIKPKGKRKWTIISFWDKYGRGSSIDEPMLDNFIKQSALHKIKDLLTVKTWSEWKS